MSFSWAWNGEWNDVPLGGDPNGAAFIVEYAVPEPGTYLLFGVGIISLTLYGRRRARRKKKA